jgi:hypothetical protein
MQETLRELGQPGAANWTESWPWAKLLLALSLAQAASGCESLPRLGPPVLPAQLPQPPAQVLMLPPQESFVERLEKLLSSSPKTQKQPG